LTSEYITNINKKETNENLVSLRRYAEANNVPIITFEGIRFLNQIIRISGAKRILEIGTAIGYSAIAMALENDVSITTIEREPDMIAIAKKNIAANALDDQITIIEGDALEMDETSFGPVDFIFIDGAKAQSAKFFVKYGTLLQKGGIIVTDNLLFHDLVFADKGNLSRNVVRLTEKIDEFNHFLVEQTEYDTTIYELGDGMSLSIKKE